MSLARLTESIRRAGENLSEARRVLLADLSKDFDAPPPSTMRRIVRDWTSDGVELAGHRVRTEKNDGRLYLVIAPKGEELAPAPMAVDTSDSDEDEKPVVEKAVVREMPVRSSLPLYHQFGRVVSL